MNIYNSGYIPYNPYLQTGFPVVQYGPCPINMGPVQDVFQKSTANMAQGAQEIQGAVQCAPVAGVWDEKRIEAIYNKTYDTVMAQNPITRELNIQKPPLNFNSKDKREEPLAFYAGGTNEITIRNMDFFRGNLYFCKILNTNGETVDIKVTGQKGLAAVSKNYPECTVLSEKLNDSEKELYISSMLAHELRHCIQTHLVASTEGCADEYKELLLELKTALNKVIETKKEMAAAEGEPYVPGDEDAKLQKLNYGLSYKPKKLLSENSLFKFSLSQSDNKYLSIKDHLLAGYKKNGLDKKDSSSYYHNPLEIDAYNYECEFFTTQAKNYPAGTLRKDITDNIAIELMLRVYDENFPFIRQ